MADRVKSISGQDLGTFGTGNRGVTFFETLPEWVADLLRVLIVRDDVVVAGVQVTHEQFAKRLDSCQQIRVPEGKL